MRLELEDELYNLVELQPAFKVAQSSGLVMLKVFLLPSHVPVDYVFFPLKLGLILVFPFDVPLGYV